MIYYIYTLHHPITGEIRYVGKTNNLRLSYNRHNCPQGNTYKENWIRKLHSLNQKHFLYFL